MARSRKAVDQFRTVDLARRAGCSVQLIRNLERDGALPPAPRTATGYRRFGAVHLHALVAYRQLAVAAGPPEARQILRAVHREPVGAALARLDALHAQLDTERRAVQVARQVVGAIGAEPVEEVGPEDVLTITELAGALGVRPSTLRHWEAEGLLRPERDGVGGARRYRPAQVRDARIVHQLRLAGHRIEALRTVLPQLSGDRRQLRTVLASREAAVDEKSLALLRATAALSAVLDEWPAQLSDRS